MKASNLPLPVVFIILLILPALVLAPAASEPAR